MKDYRMQHIVQLFIAEMQQTISKEEYEELKLWLGESDMNRNLYFQWKNKLYVQKRIASLLKNDFKQASHDMDLRIEESKRRIKLRFGKRMIWMAASVAIFLGITLALWKYSNPSTDFIPYPLNEQVILTLSDGRQIEVAHLDESLQLEGASVSVDAGKKQLVYVGDSCRSDSVFEESYNELSVPQGCEYCLELSDHTKVWLNAASSLRYPMFFSGDTRTVYLSGEAYFEVSHSEEKPFIVKSGEHILTVLGTKFNITAYEGEEVIRTTLAEGKVAVEVGQQCIELAPGEQLRYEKREGKMNVAQVDVGRALSWREGYIVFDGLSLADILQVLSRWYGVEFDIRAAHLKDIVFEGGVSKYKDLRKILEVLEQTGEVEFHSNNGKYIVVESTN